MKTKKQLHQTRTLDLVMIPEYLEIGGESEENFEYK
jgi:hypothetical protein